MLSTYQANLAGLLLACGALFATQSAPEEKRAKTEEGDEKVKRQYARTYQGTQWHFYVVYTLVMGADWLQVSPLTITAKSPQAELQIRVHSSTLSTKINTASLPK